ncbi:aldehyde dehydrogenase family protein [Methanolacinia paynteri]|uniref:aldehyde dehydrogenase family protein n=1 Tax=Methanolacinia paynteri TaxID=230356 RepID=UPI00064FBF26|nr:aldehyde dehydrogenase family protein [Methanolacinia paynteri]
MNAREFILCGKRKRSDRHLDVINPYTGDVFDRICLCGEEEIEEAIAGSSEAFKETSALAGYEKMRILERLAELIGENREKFVEILINEGGKVRSLASAEVDRSIETIKISGEEAVRQTGEIIPLDRTEAGRGYTCFSRRFPVGTVLAITPFNYPLNLACHKIGPAIAAGNPFILKPASKTPVSGLLLGELVLEAGYPAEAVSVVPCEFRLAEKMVRDERIAFLSFTGSPGVGWHLKSIAGRKKVSLELGGNAAAIVHSDADLEHAASRIATGACANAGQVCISVQRVFVQNAVFREFLERLSSAFESLKNGDPDKSDTFVGPMISEEAAGEAWRKVQAAISGGAKIISGGRYDGKTISPTIITDATPEMEINSTEIFAPVVTVTPYEKFSEAVDLANNSVYGLQAGVFTSDIGNAFYAYEKIEAGGVIINDIPTFRVDLMPYGGVKMSGFGREGPAYALAEMTEQKIMVIRQKPVAD